MAENLVNNRENATAIAVNNAIYLFGGSNKVDNRWTLIKSIEKFQENCWVVINTVLEKPTAGIGGFVNGFGNIFIFGGTREKGTYTSDFYEFNTESEQISSCERLNLLEADYFSSISIFHFCVKVYIMGTLIGCHIFDEKCNEWVLNRYK